MWRQRWEVEMLKRRKNGEWGKVRSRVRSRVESSRGCLTRSMGRGGGGNHGIMRSLPLHPHTLGQGTFRQARLASQRTRTVPYCPGQVRESAEGGRRKGAGGQGSPCRLGQGLVRKCGGDPGRWRRPGSLVGVPEHAKNSDEAYSSRQGSRKGGRSFAEAANLTARQLFTRLAASKCCHVRTEYDLLPW